MKELLAILIVFGITFNIIISGCGNKEEDSKIVQKNPEVKTETQQQSSTQTQTNTSSSEVSKIWGQVEKINESMGKGINSGKSGHLEEPIAEIIALLKTIPEKTQSLQPASLEVIKSKVNELRKIGVIMDRYQHGNKTSELKEEYTKFTSALNEIKNVLPM